MDTTKTPDQIEAFVAEQLAIIKGRMPETYKSIQARAQESDLGKRAFALVRRGIRGEVNCFYAVEAGYVVGSPFNMPEIIGPVAELVLKFGCGFLIMWPEPQDCSARVLSEQQRGA